MATCGHLNLINLLSTSLLLVGQVVFGSPAELQGRGGCNADNCLRELEHTSLLASPFCSSYLGVGVATIVSTVTVTTTLPAFTDTSVTELAKRATTTSFSPISCTENPTAVYSGCSCLLASPTTVTATATSALPTQCNAAANYGISSNGFGILDGPGQANHYFEFTESIRGACCARCFETPNCLAFAEFVDANGSDSIECLIWEIYESPTTVDSSICPFGTLTIDLTQPTPAPGGDTGVGPCGFGVVE